MVKRVGLGSSGSSSKAARSALAAGAAGRAMATLAAGRPAAGPPAAGESPAAATGVGLTSWLIRASSRQATQTEELMRMSRMTGTELARL